MYADDQPVSAKTENRFQEEETRIRYQRLAATAGRVPDRQDADPEEAELRVCEKWRVCG